MGDHPRRVKVGGDMFHPVVPAGAIYVGRSGPGLPASKYANPFALRRRVWRNDPLRPYLTAAVLDLTTDEDWVVPSLPAVLTPGTPAVAVAAYSRWFVCQQRLMATVRADLAGRDLACWCRLPVPGELDTCHAAWLIALANPEEAGDG